MTNYVAITYGCKSGNYPIQSRQVKAEEVILLYLTINSLFDPTLFMLLIIVFTNKDPDASEKVWDHDYLDNETGYVFEEFYLFWIHERVALKHEFFEIHEVCVKLKQFQVSENHKRWIYYRVWYYSYYINKQISFHIIYKYDKRIMLSLLANVVDFEKVKHNINDLSKNYECVIKPVIQKFFSLFLVTKESIITYYASCEEKVQEYHERDKKMKIPQLDILRIN